MRKWLVPLALGALFGAADVRLARAEGADASCTPIRSLPFLIAMPGRYCVARDITVWHNPPPAPGHKSSGMITVRADDVVIDMQGHTFEDRSNGIATNGVAVLGLNRKRVTVKNGTMKGFFIGVALVGEDGGEGHVVESMHFENVHYAAVSLNKTKGFVVRDNDMRDMGGGNAWYMPHAILVSGEGVVEDNLILNVHPNHHEGRIDTEAISVKDGNVRVARNVIKNDAVPEGESWGIRVLRRGQATIEGNRIENFKHAVVIERRDGDVTNVDDTNVVD